MLRRPTLSIEALILLTAIGFAIGANGAFWRGFLSGREAPTLELTTLLVGTFAILVAAHFALMLPLVWRRGGKVVLGMLVLATALAVACIDRFGVYLDDQMMRNVLETDLHEVAQLLSPGLIAEVCLWAVLPLALLAWVRVSTDTWQTMLKWRLGGLAVAVATAGIAVFLGLDSYTSHFTERRNDRYLITPANFVVGTVEVLFEGAESVSAPRQVIGADAQASSSLAPSSRPVLFVLVLGETARAASFSLGGYERQTNPELGRRDVIYFGDVEACGTSTSVSLPCMFSTFTRADSGKRGAGESDSVLDILGRAGFDVVWWENNSGCKGVCAEVGRRYFKREDHPALCQKDGCLDEVLLTTLNDPIRGGNRFLVLHAQGSHGPAYFRRFPERFEAFQPSCGTTDFDACSREEIRNAYDNTILYADFVVAELIDRLSALDRRADTALLFVSDHGESLGENGIYLHGLPMSIAPEVQTRVPMILWTSPGFAQRFDLDLEGLRGAAHEPYRHDHLSHSLLGLFEIETAVYDRELDLFAPHRSAGRGLYGHVAEEPHTELRLGDAR